MGSRFPPPQQKVIRFAHQIKIWQWAHALCLRLDA